MNNYRRKTKICAVYPQTLVRHLRIKPRKSHAEKVQYISVVHKVLWIGAVLLSSTLSIWHLVISFQKYLEQPIGTNIWIETFKQYTLPGLMLCPSTYKMVYDFQVQFDKHCQKHRKCKLLSEDHQKHLTFEEMGISLLDLWLPKTNMTTDTYAQCCYAVNSTKCNSTDWIQRSRVDTVAGPCQAFKTDLQWHFVGKSWVYWIEVTNVTDLPVEAFSIDLFTSNLPNLMFISKAFIINNSYNDLEMSAITFEYLNTTRNPCSTEEELYQCTNQWITPQLRIPNMKCRWPLMNSTTLPLCNSMLQVNEIQSKLLALIFSSENTDECKRQCQTTRYSLTRVNGINNDYTKKTLITMTLKSNTKVIVREYFAYPISSLIAEVGGSIGLFLGISLLSCLSSLLGFLNKIFYVTILQY